MINGVVLKRFIIIRHIIDAIGSKEMYLSVHVSR